MVRRTSALLCLAWVALLATPSGNSQSSSKPGTITVSEGTSMAVAVSPDGARLAIDLQGSLWTLPRSGGAAKRITGLLHDARQPSWSPDGKRLAFQAYSNGTWDIWTANSDGSKPVAVTSGPFDDREPHWSPDGRRVAFSSDRSGNYDIWVVDVATGAVQRVTRDDGNDYWPAWSGDGREIAFVGARASAPGIYATTLQGTERLISPTARTPGAPSWIPGGAGVAFSTVGEGVARLMLGARELSDKEDVSPFRPQWALDARGATASLIYTADGKIKERPEGGEGAVREIPFHAELVIARAEYTPRPRDFDSASPRRVLGIVRPGLSPDGKQVVFSALGDIWIGNQGEQAKRVTDDEADDTDPALSPDGKHLAFASDRGGSFDIWIRDLATGTDRRMTSTADPEMRPTWSPDGATLAFTTLGSALNGQLSTVDVKSGAVNRLLTTTNGPMTPGWSQDGKTVYLSVLRTYSSRYREGVNQALAVPVAGGTARPITLVADKSSGKRGEGPAWSPDGRHLALVLDGQLHVMPLTPGGEPAGPPRAIPAGAADQISWSADSRSILFSDSDRLMLASIDGLPPRPWPIVLTYARRLSADTLTIHAGRVVDGLTDRARENVDVLVERNRIVAIQPHTEGAHRGRVIDASASTLMPGLIEGHGHYTPDYGTRFGRLHLAYGITSVRSPGGHPYASVAEREAVESGRRPGPRLFLAGYLVDGNRIYYPMASAAPTARAVDGEVERARQLEYDLLKTYVRLPDALQQRAIIGAHQIGIPVSSHEIYPAATFGIDSVEHFGATSRRGYSPKQSLLGVAYGDVLGIVTAAQMTVTPTMALGRARPAIRQSATLRGEPRWQLQPEWVRAPYDAPATPALAAAITTPSPLRAYHKAGARIIAGTDSPLVPYGISLHIELEEYVAAGLSPFEALQAATINVARALRVERDLGTIERGKLADMVIVDGNPLADIRAARNVRTVIANGVVYPLEELARLPATQSTTQAARPMRTEAEARARAEANRQERQQQRLKTGAPPELVSDYVKANIGPVPESLGVSPFYRKYADAMGIPVIASDKVPDAALLVARDIVNTMLEARPDIRKALIARNWRTGVIAEVEMTMDIPEYSKMKRPGAPPDEPVTQADRDYHANRSRGLGGNPTTGAEENLLGYPGTRYWGEHIFVHEFAHAIMGGGIRNVDPAMFAEIRAAYDKAMAEGKYVHPDGRKHYATTNAGEYWAEGVQWWFFSNYGECFTGNIKVETPEEFAAYDPTLNELIGRVFTTHRIPMDVFHGKRIRKVACGP